MIFGHQKNLKIFSRLLKENRFPHAVLFAGPKKIGKRSIAIKIAKYLEGHYSHAPSCPVRCLLSNGVNIERDWEASSGFSHTFFDFSQRDCHCQTCELIKKGTFPEVSEIKEEGGQIPIQKIREIRQKLSFSSFYPFKIVIINDTETLSPEATGALLKILEEPKGRTIFFLLTSRPNILVKTIISRVEIFKFYPLSQKEINNFLKTLNLDKELTREELSQVLDFSLGRPGIAKELAIDKNRIRYYNSLLETARKIKELSVFEQFLIAEKLEKEEKVEDFLFLSEFWFRDLFLEKNRISQISFSFEKEVIEKEAKNFSKEKIKEIIKEIQKIKNYLLFSNTSRLLALENLFLRI